MIFEAISGIAGKVLDKVVPDAAERERIAIEIAKEANKVVELEVQDRDSARKREIAVKDHTPSVLVYVITLLLALDLWYFNTYPPGESIKPILENVTTALRDGWIMAIAYYYGASHRRAS